MALLKQRGVRRGLVFVVLCFGICWAQGFNEYQVKAAFLYSFAKFVEWPDGHECKILFIAASERGRMSALLASVGTPGLLTVGDTAEFAAQGGVIGLRLDGERIRLLVNLSSAEKAQLRVSSRLLSIAILVK